jgi:serine-type D-Ala-D-Ala carboxypeptidase
LNTIERKFISRLGEVAPLWKSATEGFQIQVHESGKLKIDLQVGKTYQYYDLASLTKIISGAPLVMRAVSDHGLSLNHDLSREFDWMLPNRLRLKSLLSHSNGLTWWKPYFKKLTIEKNGKLKRRFLSLDASWFELEKYLTRDIKQGLRAKKIHPGCAAIYSDLDLFTLGIWLSKLYQRSLSDMLLEHVEHLDISKLHYNAYNLPKYARSEYSPTERCEKRGKILCGEVHDENTWSLGGVSNHAGLFGSISSLSEFGLQLRQSVVQSRAFCGVPNSVAKRFFQRAVPKKTGDWAHGFVMPTKGSASCGKYFSSRSIGHTGFTGTSLWLDPKNDILVSILSNRVYPSRKNRDFVKLRPLLHDFAVEALKR